VEVGGTVLSADGKGMDKFIVKFHPLDDANKFNTLTCVTKDGGRFQGKVAPGSYKVTLAVVPQSTGPHAGGPAGGGAAPAKDDAKGGLIPASYTSPEKTPWEVTIPAEGNKELKLQVK